MAVNGMSVGKDYQLTFYDPNTGGLVDFGDIQRFRAEGKHHDIKSMPYNDDPLYGYIPDGYSGSFECTRKNPKLERLQIALNQAFSSGQNILAGYITESVHEADGTTTRYQYTKAVFKITEICDVSREKTVPQRVDFMASNKIEIA